MQFSFKCNMYFVALDLLVSIMLKNVCFYQMQSALWPHGILGYKGTHADSNITKGM